MTMLAGPIRSLGRRRELILELVRRELRDRHTGQVLGVLWAYGHPLILMLLYTVLFAYVFPARFGSGAQVADYSVNVFAGIMSWLAFQDILGRASTIMLGHGSLVKQIVFPTEVLPIKTALASAIPYSVGLVFVLFYAAWHETLTAFAAMLIPIILLQILAMAGLAFFLSAIGVFFRDLRDIVTVFCTINLFAQPILYNPFATPRVLRAIFYANPFSYAVWCWQDALFYGMFRHPLAWVLFPLGSLATLAVGFVVFERSRHHFGDAL